MHFFYVQWKENFAKLVKLEKANLHARLETLRTQINPHFLFNSLNTLITYVEDNRVAMDYIENLSDFLRYTLNNKENEVVKLKDEIEIAQKYYYLQKSRFGKNLNVEFNIHEEFINYSVLPLAIQMVMENAIKHNIIAKDKPLNVKMYVNSNNYLVIENNLQKKQGVASTQLGLTNIIERYNFLTDKEIKIIETLDKFQVEMPLIKISDN